MINKLRDYGNFKTMVSPIVLQFVYALGFAIITFIGVVACTSEDKQQNAIGVGLIVVGNLVWRIMCECLVIAFSIYERLASIDNKLRPRVYSAAPAEFKLNPIQEKIQKTLEPETKVEYIPEQKKPEQKKPIHKDRYAGLVD